MYFGVFEFKPVFERCDDFVDAMHREVVVKCAMAGKRDVIPCATDLDLVDIDDLVVDGGGGAERFFDTAIGLDDFLGLLDGGGFALDVSEDGIDFRSLAYDLGLESADEAVSSDEGEIFVEFDVELDMELALMRLHAEIVYRNGIAGGYGANPVEDAAGAGLARNGVDDDVSLGQHVMNGFRSGADEFTGVLEGVVHNGRGIGILNGD